MSVAGMQNDADEVGWKMVSGDVFRTPKDPLLLCVEVGTGVQILTSASVTLIFAALGAPAASTLLCSLSPPSSIPSNCTWSS